MGFAKNEAMRWDDLGITPGENRNVCADCICDPVLAQFVNDNSTETDCDYCERTHSDPIACSLSDLVEVMAETIGEEWTDPVDELPHDGREGGYQGEMIDGSDLLEEIGFEPNSPELFDDVVEYFNGHDWCRRDYFSTTPSERLRFGWQKFCHVVMYQRRYTFWTDFTDEQSEYHPDYLPAGVMLGEIHSVIQELALIREFPVGTRYWRAATHQSAETLAIPSRFTSPPVESARYPNRMSPAGIPMFYGAEDFNTAVIEVSGIDAIPDRSASAVQFESCKPLRLLDLVHLNEHVSYFAPNGRHAWHRTAFLRFFANDISKQIERDERQHIDYVPTQVLTEYVRYHMSTDSGHPIDGIRYLSSRNHYPCVVLFFDSDDCLMSRDGRPQSLHYVPGSELTIALDKPRK